MSEKWDWNTAKTAHGAGIIVVRKFNKKWKVLGLWARGGYDIPKGHMEENDDVFKTALRETREETGIEKLNFMWENKPFREGNLFIYLAKTNQDAVILKNAESNIYEHEYATWLTWEQMLAQTYDYLKPAIVRARETVNAT